MENGNNPKYMCAWKNPNLRKLVIEDRMNYRTGSWKTPKISPTLVTAVRALQMSQDMSLELILEAALLDYLELSAANWHEQQAIEEAERLEAAREAEERFLLEELEEITGCSVEDGEDQDGETIED